MRRANRGRGTTSGKRPDEGGAGGRRRFCNAAHLSAAIYHYLSLLIRENSQTQSVPAIARPHCDYTTDLSASRGHSSSQIDEGRSVKNASDMANTTDSIGRHWRSNIRF